MKPAALVLLVLATLAGCIAPAGEGATVEPASAPLQEPGLLAAPRLVHVPAGDSYTIVRLNATAEDWVEMGDDTWLLRGFEFPEDAEIEAYSVLWLDVEDDTARVGGAHLGSGGGAGGNGNAGEPAAVTTFAVLQVVGASEPFDMRFGAFEKPMDFELQGETIAGDVLAQGDRVQMAWYFEFASPFGALFGDAPFVVGFEPEDTRVQAPGSVVGGAGALRLAFEHEVDAPSVHSFMALASSFQGQRIGTWSVEHASDDETFADDGPMVEPFGPWVAASGVPHKSVGGAFVLDIAAEAMPLTLVHALTAPFDAVALGLEFDGDRADHGGLPVVARGADCVHLGDPTTVSPAACLVLD